ncbi:MAG: leucine-rich repeat protein [Alphaproteobacteria bacterium]|nr:MAG: leucine-rich repeat protein [Alphaproteobacteria bacterium]
MSFSNHFTPKLILAIVISWALPLLAWILTCLSHTSSRSFYKPGLYALSDDYVTPDSREEIFKSPAVGRHIMNALSLEDALKATSNPTMRELFIYSKHMSEAEESYVNSIMHNRPISEKTKNVLSVADTKRSQGNIVHTLKQRLGDKPLLRKTLLPKWLEEYFEGQKLSSSIDPRIKEYMRADYIYLPKPEIQPIPEKTDTQTDQEYRDVAESIERSNIDAQKTLARKLLEAQQAIIQEAQEKYTIFESQLKYVDEIEQKLNASETQEDALNFIKEKYNILPTTQYLVISDDDLMYQLRKLEIEYIFKQRPDLTLVLYFYEKEIELGRSDLPPSVKKLHVIGSNVEEVRSYFLTHCQFLEEFDGSRLTNLKEVGGEFLANCRSLKRFNGSDWFNLERIWKNFLFACPSLEYFNGSGWTSLKKIGENYLSKCNSLKKFDSFDWISLETIDHYFLAYCTALESFDGSGWINIKKIGSYFLSQSKSLKRFRSSDWRNLKTIGCCFLSDCTSLEYFDISDCKNLTSVDNRGFLKGVAPTTLQQILLPIEQNHPYQHGILFALKENGFEEQIKFLDKPSSYR